MQCPNDGNPCDCKDNLLCLEGDGPRPRRIKTPLIDFRCDICPGDDTCCQKQGVASVRISNEVSLSLDLVARSIRKNWRPQDIACGLAAALEGVAELHRRLDRIERGLPKQDDGK